MRLFTRAWYNEDLKVVILKIGGQFRIASSLVLLLALFALADAQRPPSSAADLILLNAHVITMDRTQPTAEALAIRADRIVWVGANRDANRFFSTSTRKLDLQGATVLPGIIDAHTHLVS